MKKTVKTVLSTFLVLAFFCSVGCADADKNFSSENSSAIADFESQQAHFESSKTQSENLSSVNTSMQSEESSTTSKNLGS